MDAEEETVGAKAAREMIEGGAKGGKGREYIHRWVEYRSMHLRSSSLTRWTEEEQDRADQRQDGEEGEVEEKVA